MNDFRTWDVQPIVLAVPQKVSKSYYRSNVGRVITYLCVILHIHVHIVFIQFANTITNSQS